MLKTKADKLGVTKISDLAGQVAGPDPLRLARVPPADRLPGRAARSTTASSSSRSTRSTSASATRCSTRARPTSRSSSRPTRSSRRTRTSTSLLEDDKDVFPAGQRDLRHRPVDGRRRPGPDYEATIEKVQKGLTLPVMQELNARVDIDKQDPAAVADRVPEGGRLHQVDRAFAAAPFGEAAFQRAGADPPALWLYCRASKAKSLRSTTGGNGGPKGVHTPGANRNQLVRSAALGASPPANSVGRRESAKRVDRQAGWSHAPQAWWRCLPLPRRGDDRARLAGRLRAERRRRRPRRDHHRPPRTTAARGLDGLPGRRPAHLRRRLRRAPAAATATRARTSWPPAAPRRWR